MKLNAVPALLILLLVAHPQKAVKVGKMVSKHG